MAVCSIQKHFIRDIQVKFGVPNLSQSPHIRQNSNGCVSGFQMFFQSFIKENCHNSRTRNGLDINLGPVTKLYKKTQQRQ